jgi:hypothetical protein
MLRPHTLKATKFLGIGAQIANCQFISSKQGLNSTAATSMEDNIKFAQMLNFPKSTTNTVILST